MDHSPREPASVLATAVSALLAVAAWIALSSVLHAGDELAREPGPVTAILLAVFGVGLLGERVIARRSPAVLLLSVAALTGAATSVLLALWSSNASVLLAALFGAPLLLTRILVELFGRRRSPLARRLAMLILYPAVLIAVVELVHLSRGKLYTFRHTDGKLLLAFAVLGPAVIPVKWARPGTAPAPPGSPPEP